MLTLKAICRSAQSVSFTRSDTSLHTNVTVDVLLGERLISYISTAMLEAGVGDHFQNLHQRSRCRGCTASCMQDYLVFNAPDDYKYQLRSPTIASTF